VVALAQDSYDYRRNVSFAAIKTFAFKATPPLEPIAEKTTTYDSPLLGTVRTTPLPLNSRVAG
jgi:hypothetical protein